MHIEGSPDPPGLQSGGCVCQTSVCSIDDYRIVFLDLATPLFRLLPGGCGH